ncbi:hypothetical protein [Aquimarina mytili]|nr:hypothetical protein [Aquimarina mytili]
MIDFKYRQASMFSDGLAAVNEIV